MQSSKTLYHLYYIILLYHQSVMTNLIHVSENKVSHGVLNARAIAELFLAHVLQLVQLVLLRSCQQLPSTLNTAALLLRSCQQLTSTLHIAQSCHTSPQLPTAHPHPKHTTFYTSPHPEYRCYTSPHLLTAPRHPVHSCYTSQ